MPPKRKSLASSSSTPKKPKNLPVVTLGKSAVEIHGSGKALDETQIAELVAYIQYLETQAEEHEKAANSLSSKGGKELSQDEIATEAARLSAIVERGISKLMKWKPSCKNGSATYSFEGICSTPAVMAYFLRLDKPEDVTKFKAKRYTQEEFEENIMLGEITVSVRYCTLHLTGNVNLRWDYESGVFKFTGKYGQYGSGKAPVGDTENA